MGNADSGRSGTDQPPPALDPNTAVPHAGISEILGLVEILKSKGGTEDIYKLAAELQMEFGEMLNVIKGAEIIGLVHTPGGDVVLEPLGAKIAKAKIAEKKDLIGEQIKKVPVFRKIRDFLNEREDHQARRDEVLEKLAELIPNENAEQSFSTIVNWGRYSELFGYNDDSETFYLDVEGQSAT
jgi:NitT/TauT family transport system ATP-binding protein